MSPGGDASSVGDGWEDDELMKGTTEILSPGRSSSGGELETDVF